ncbi:hypothetical protein AVEN_223693-1, partial [Araneus ventricosus]
MASGEWHQAEGGGQKQAFLQTITKPITLWIVQ